MKRKVNRVGDSTHTVSLPSDWVKKFNIQKGHELEVSPKGNALMISTEGTKSSERIDIEINHLDPRMAAKVIIVAFQKGYDTIKLHYKSEDVLYAVQERIAEMMGFSIMEQGSNYCVIQNISSKLEVSFESLIRKAFLIVIDTLKDSLDYYKKGDKEKMLRLRLRDKEVNKFCYYCQRVLNKDYYHVDLEGYTQYYLIRVLEDIGDEIKALIPLLAKEKKYKKAIGNLLQESINILETSNKIFFSPKESLLADFYQTTDALKENIFMHAKDMNKNEMEISFYLRTISDLCYHFAMLKSDIACRKK